MDVAKAFTFFAEDERWLTKLGIGTAVILASMFLSVLLIGILGFFIVAGYSVRLLKNVRDGDPRPLPEWDRWGDDLVTGLKLGVVFLVYALPILIIMLPVGLGAALANVSDQAAFASVSLFLCAGLFMTLYAIALTLAQPGILVAFARDEEIGSGLDFRGIYAWTRQRLGPVLVVLLITWAVGALVVPLISVAGVILCVVGLIISVPLSILLGYLIQFHLFGQLARMERGAPVMLATAGAPSPAPTLDAAPPSDVQP
jgi:hypothetical protein